jgi:hypothetical protein
VHPKYERHGWAVNRWLDPTITSNKNVVNRVVAAIVYRCLLVWLVGWWVMVVVVVVVVVFGRVGFVSSFVWIVIVIVLLGQCWFLYCVGVVVVC